MPDGHLLRHAARAAPAGPGPSVDHRSPRRRAAPDGLGPSEGGPGRPALLLSASCSRWPGSSWSCRSTGWQRSSSSTSRFGRRAGREDALVPSETLRERLMATWRDHRLRQGALVERLPAELTEIDPLASAPVRSATDISARLASALFPDDVPKRSSCSPANDTTGDGQTEAALAASRGVQSKRGASASATSTRSSSSA